MRDYKEFFFYDPSKSDEDIVIFVNNDNEALARDIIENYLKLNSILFYECMLDTPIDKIYEFYDDALFYNLTIVSNHENRESIQEKSLQYKIIRKNQLLLVFVDRDEGLDSSLDL